MKQEELLEQYRKHKEVIDERLEEFRQLRDAGEKRIFQELVFVILTTQTEAKKAWEAAEQLEENNLLETGSEEKIAEVLRENGVFYEENKASYIVENRQNLSQPTLSDPEKGLKLKQKIDPEELDSTREWLVENIKGISWKGASHFLRNIGYGSDFAIISGHILKVLAELEVIETAEQPSSKEEYLKIEKKVQELAEKLGIDIQALDLAIWSLRTGEVFK